MDKSCYAIRRVNPFLGVLQIVENDSGRASSANGVVWDIEVAVAAEDAPQQLQGQKAYYRYGLWSKQEGLAGRPLAPHLDSDPLTMQCQHIITDIESRLEALPFRQIDDVELWLFDSVECRPIALLASALPGADLPTPTPRFWSACLGAVGVTSQRRFPQTQQLEALVRQRAGFNVVTHWVHRQSDRSAIDLRSGEVYPAEIFPATLITREWGIEEDAVMVSEYLHWTAPALLTLQHLSQAERSELESHLHVQAISIEHHNRLYPVILDKAKLKAARVQCQIQNSQTDS